MKRRKFILNAGFSGIATLSGLNIVFGAKMPKGYRILGLQEPDPFKMFGLDSEMVVLNKKPFNIEAQAHLLDDKVTPNSKMFIRNNGLIPKSIDEDQWTLQIEGESVKEIKSYTLNDLKTKFKSYTYQLTLECGGNGRSEFDPPAKGNQWTVGAVHCAQWTGVRLKDVLEDSGVKEDAVYIGYHAKDVHLSGDSSKEPISRGVPIRKAYQNETLLAYEMNGAPIPLVHGFPLRLVAGGWPASASGKWIHKISVRNREHDGSKMKGMSYRVPRFPVSPGEKVEEKDMKIIESMPVKSIITYPKTGATFKKSQHLHIRGHAWAGELEVSRMEYSIDFGATWVRCDLEGPVNRLAWQHFKADILFPQIGYYEIWARATDTDGNAQPMLVPGWNPKGYLNNACHRIAVKVV
ncbi:sulfite oxidase [Lutimonas zeaxanthinifaciens]|uniref:sulfite oxidase n=1 Tax=Lutimonas zeaxanthinifaciens TaxID=3060215 RepID=UPI00265D398B|nr:sulfite oxidase [Lutimonas sp. YSD2104]WKK64597.1 sulfite oxidase [Lutimonas sp. YSD2104]